MLGEVIQSLNHRSGVLEDLLVGVSVVELPHALEDVVRDEIFNAGVVVQSH